MGKGYIFEEKYFEPISNLLRICANFAQQKPLSLNLQNKQRNSSKKNLYTPRIYSIDFDIPDISPRVMLNQKKQYTKFSNNICKSVPINTNTYYNFDQESISRTESLNSRNNKINNEKQGFNIKTSFIREKQNPNFQCDSSEPDAFTLFSDRSAIVSPISFKSGNLSSSPSIYTVSTSDTVGSSDCSEDEQGLSIELNTLYFPSVEEEEEDLCTLYEDFYFLDNSYTDILLMLIKHLISLFLTFSKRGLEFYKINDTIKYICNNSNKVLLYTFFKLLHIRPVDIFMQKQLLPILELNLNLIYQKGLSLTDKELVNNVDIK